MHYVYELTVYPREVRLRDGRSVILKAMSPEDGEALLEFFQHVDQNARYFLKEEHDSPKVIQRWVTELDYNRALPLLAWVDGKVVADSSLHRIRGLARRDIGEGRIVVRPEYRNQGLGTAHCSENWRPSPMNKGWRS